MTSWEYTQDTCDVWQIAHLCNHFAGHGWDVVTVIESTAMADIPERVGDSAGPHRRALRPHIVLFRRPITDEETSPRSTP